MLDYSAQPLAGATLDDLDPNQRVRLRRIIQNRSGGEKTLLSLPDEELDIALRLVTNVAGNYVPTVTGIGSMSRLWTQKVELFSPYLIARRDVF